MQPRDIQHETLRIYKILIDLREDWCGKLVLCCGSGCALFGAPTAVSIAGGTTLAIDSDAEAMKSAMRAGYLDFIVNSLDEALRTLKNEIRQRRPLSVGLIAEVEPTLAEIVERGLQPDLQLVQASAAMNRGLSNPEIEALCARGMLQRKLFGSDDSERDDSPLWLLDGKRCHEYFFPAPGAAALREIDAALLIALPAQDVVRRRWLERVPTYLREARTRGRWAWLSEEELESLAQAGLSPVPQP